MVSLNCKLPSESCQNGCQNAVRTLSDECSEKKKKLIPRWRPVQSEPDCRSSFYIHTYIQRLHFKCQVQPRRPAPPRVRHRHHRPQHTQHCRRAQVHSYDGMQCPPPSSPIVNCKFTCPCPVRTAAARRLPHTQAHRPSPSRRRLSAAGTSAAGRGTPPLLGRRRGRRCPALSRKRTR